MNKNNSTGNHLNEKVPIKHLLLIMRTTLILLFTCVFCSMADIGYTQNTKVSINKRNVSIKEILNEIENQTDYLFIYNNEVNTDSEVSVKAKQKAVSNVLNDLLRDRDVKYTMEGNHILLSKVEKAVETTKEIVSNVQQQKKQITGNIVDSNGVPIIGANIIEDGTTNGTVTDIDGNFTLSVDNNAVLRVSYIGYLEQNINTANNTNFKIVLREDTQALEELVVVGYGTQRKVNLTGSVSSIDMSDIAETRPVTSLSASLHGLAAGLHVNQGNARPGGDGATLRIRGQGTLNNSSPLVIIDGVEGNMNDLNAQDVENISVLKDAASAAIYGSRAANGVILITTKSGKEGTLRLNYNGQISTQTATNLITPVSNYADYMELFNEALRNGDPNAALQFSQESIDLWRANENGDQLKYPNTDWTKEIFSPSTSQSHNVSFSGGTDKLSLFGSFGYLDNPGIIENSGFERYSARINADAQVKEWLKLGINASGYVSSTDIGSNLLDGSVFAFAAASTPGMVIRSSDGRYGAPNNSEDDPQANNVLERVNSQKGDIKRNQMQSRFFAELKPFEGFTLEGSYNYTYRDQLREQQPVFIDRWNFLTNTIARSGTGRTSVTNRDDKQYRYFMDATARYENKLAGDRLNYNIMAGASQETYKESWFQAGKFDLTDPSLSVLDAATVDASASGNASDWAMRSYFGRLNLNWMEKYLFEANLRYDGSSRFRSGKDRWGAFPSFSAAWRMDQENFMNDINWLDNLKLRLSYGSLGNNSIGNYEYQALYASSNYILNDALVVGFAQNALANAMLTWESTYITNVGLDFDVLQGRLSGTIDLFNKQTKNILINLPAPLVVGNASIPNQNAAEVRNRGLELTLGWHDKIGEVNYRINGNFSFVDNEVTKFKGDERTISGTNVIQEGFPINIQYVLAVDRIIQTDEDLAIVQDMIDNAPIDEVTNEKRNPFAAFGRPQKGDFLYKDTNGDGVVNNDDRYMVGNGTAPRVNYGLTLGMDWKGFDLSILLQGVTGLKVHWLDNYYRPTVNFGNNINKEIADGRWFEGRTDAKYPRLLQQARTINSQPSDFWMADKSYLRVKNIQLSYLIPKDITQKIGIEGIRLYTNLENYFTFTNYKGFDPEISGINYPIMKQTTFGLNVSF